MNAAPRVLNSPGGGRLRDGLWRMVHAVYEPWRQFWFTPADPTPLGVMRILFGGMLLYTQLVWGLNLEGFVGADGWQGATLVRTLQSDQFAWSFWWWIPHGLHLTAHLLCLVILLLFLLGTYTPVTSVLAYLITISYASRAPMANYGLDQINGLAALYLAIGPSGSRLSIDRWRLRYRAVREQFALGLEPVVAPVEPSSRANLALRLVQVHLCVIYVFACLSKLQGTSWWDGTAIWQAVSNLEYQSRDVTWLAWYPWLVNLLTHVTIAWEMTFWALVWRPMLRPFVLGVGTAIHLGIGAFMGMWTFGLAVIFAYIAFIPGHQISAILRRAGQLTVRLLRSLHALPASSASVRARAAWFALGLDSPDAVPVEESSALPQAAPSLAPASIATAETASSALETEQPIAVPVQGRAVTPSAPLSASNGQPRRRGDLLSARPAVLLVEGRVKRQAELQEYFFKHGFRCSITSELHQARSMLAVIDFDALVVTSSWFSEHEVAEFHDALIGGGPALPASVFLVGAAHGQSGSHGLTETPRHRVLVGSLSLRELRLLVLEVLGLSEESLRPFVARSSRSKNGRHASTPSKSIETPAETTPPPAPDVPAPPVLQDHGST